MENIDENPRKYLQLGQIERGLCLQFRQQTTKRKFKQVEILRLLIEWWISLDEVSQRKFYYEEFKNAYKPEPESSVLEELGQRIVTDVKQKDKKKYRERPRYG